MSAAETIALMRSRIAEVPAALAETLRATPPTLPANFAGKGLVATGLGSSQAAARLLVSELSERHAYSASFRPMASFYKRVPQHEDRILVVFTQGLSANACLALEHAADFAGVILVSSVTEAGLYAAGKRERLDYLCKLKDSAAVIWTHPLEDEYTILPRFIGPACAMVVALRLADKLSGLDTVVPEVLLAADLELSVCHDEGGWAEDLLAGVAFNFAGGWVEYAHNLRAKVMESLLRPPPECRDLLEFSHGAFQVNELDVSPQWVFLDDSAESVDLLSYVEPLLARAPSYRLVRSPLPGRWAIFYFELFLNARLLHAIEQLKIDLINWPGKGADEPAYSLKYPYHCVKPC